MKYLSTINSNVSSRSKRLFLPSQFFRSSSSSSSNVGLQRQQEDIVTVTHTANSSIGSTIGHIKQQSFPSIQSDATALVESLLHRTSTLIDTSQSNIIAFSGGVDSSLAAALVYRSFHSSSSSQGQQGKRQRNDSPGNLKAILGTSNSLPQRQLLLAREVADFIGIELMEVPTKEGTDEEYIANKGQACFVCKSHLYSALEAVTQTAHEMNHQHQHMHQDDVSNAFIDTATNSSNRGVILYNGTNKDDTHDPTRLGLIAAKNFSVQSPLLHITKDQVRIAAKHLNLPNHNYAASPCLRSRLALGVEATQDHLDAVQKAEERVRSLLGLDETMDMRVRMLAGKRAMVELDRRWFVNNYEKESTDHGGDADANAEDIHMRVTKIVEDRLRREGFEHYCKELGFDGGISLRHFKSGSVSR
jgi:PP-loop superfamily ATP-utilizing enzyme